MSLAIKIVIEVLSRCIRTKMKGTGHWPGSTSGTAAVMSDACFRRCGVGTAS